MSLRRCRRDALTPGAFVVRQIQPWFANVGKRLVKSPKVYLRDTGLLHALLGLEDWLGVHSHPKLGFSWEGFVLEQIIHWTRAERDTYYYRTQAGAELDLLLMRNGKHYGFECKYEDAPRSTKSMHVVHRDLQLEQLWVLSPGSERYPLWDGAEVIPLQDLPQVLAQHGLLP